MFKVCEIGLRALALGNANAKCKGNLAFQASKCSASGNAKPKYCKFFCNTAAVHSTFRISLQHNSKLNINFLFHQFSLLQSSLPLTPTLSLCLPLHAKSLFLSSHISLSYSRLAPKLGWVCGLIWAWWWVGIG